MRIPLVEDDALIREFVVEALREEEYNVVHATNGAEALSPTTGCPAASTDGRSPNIADEAFRQRDDLSPNYATRRI
ncbi:hypothetical protein BJA01nite_82900 [Bradyrhizobium japonicum]|nr:hypothetical protein BJA01nite_82900 [Bradyrhizobium japonicum]